ncbi:hypothetical protein VCB_001043 [Vibrio cholerae TMA 21]|nr:hypothetical protein VCB_001043 [Vibrio cholerae TMA 21]EJP6369646.1 DUF3709 domain-containing protein [Vibrio cholerae]HAS3151596.1 DUF3709 domain-containing protein [Vibrio cholerae]HAS3162277.1 DUF3709 domain-containing protein [Vibrio cholerae]
MSAIQYCLSLLNEAAMYLVLKIQCYCLIELLCPCVVREFVGEGFHIGLVAK